MATSNVTTSTGLAAGRRVLPLAKLRVSVSRMLRPALLLVAGLHAVEAGAHDAMVIGVLSRDSRSYSEAVRGVNEVLARFPCAAPRIASLDEGATMVAAGTIPASGGTVIAFGQRASELFPITNYPSQIACMIREVSDQSGVLLQHAAEARLLRMRRLLPGALTMGMLVA